MQFCTSASSYAVVHQPTSLGAKPSELKTFVHQELHGIHLETFVGLSNHHVSKTTNFIFSQNSPPSHLVVPRCTDKLGQVQPPSNSKVRAPRLLQYSFGDIFRHFQPSYLKNHEFYFFTKLPTKPSTFAVVHCQPWPCAQPSEYKTFVHQDFHGIHLGTFIGLSNPLISKATNFIFSQNSPPRSLAMSWCIHNLGHVQTPPNSKLSCTKNFMVFIWGHLFAFPTLTSQKPRISFFHKTHHQAI